MTKNLFPTRILHVLIFTLAFCSIVYELLLAQALSAFLANTVLRYSVTIGLYMFSMGIGSLIAEGKYTKQPILTLLRIEILITLIGGFSLIFLHGMNMIEMPRIFFSLGAHGLIIVIGILTGFEIPLFIEILSRNNESPENSVLSLNYCGAFIGTICFAFLFCPSVGLMTTVFLIGFLNALAGCSLNLIKKLAPVDNLKVFKRYYCLQIIVCVIIGICLLFSHSINEYFMMIYMKA